MLNNEYLRLADIAIREVGGYASEDEIAAATAMSQALSLLAMAHSIERIRVLLEPTDTKTEDTNA